VSTFRGSAPRYFEPTNIKRGNRFEHIMVAGGRDGPEIANVAPKDPGYWKDGESRRWTTELELGETPPTARTQSPLLREVRPLQRLWEKGYMTGQEMLEAIEANQASSYTKGTAPDVELTVVQESEEGARYGKVRVTLVEAPVFVGLSENSKAVGAPVDLKKITEEELRQLGLALAEMQVFRSPLFVRTKNYDGTEIAIELSDAKATAKGVTGKFRGAPKAGRPWKRKTKEGEKEIVRGEEVTLTKSQLLRVSLFDPEKPESVNLPSWRRMNGMKVKLRDVLSGQEFAGEPVTLPFSLIARLKSIYPQDPKRPARLISQYSGDTSKPEKVRQRVAKELEKFRRDAVMSMYKRARKIERGKASPDPFIKFGETGLSMRLNDEQQLVWVDRAGSDGVNPVALLRSMNGGTGDILVTPDNVLLLIQQARSMRTKSKRRKPKMAANPLRGPMRNYENPIHYMTDHELDMMARAEGVSVEQLLAQYQGRVMRRSDRPKKSRSVGAPSIVSAGRHAAMTGAGLQVTRVNPQQYEAIIIHPLYGEQRIGVFNSRYEAEDAAAAFRHEGRPVIRPVGHRSNPKLPRGGEMAERPARSPRRDSVPRAGAHRETLDPRFIREIQAYLPDMSMQDIRSRSLEELVEEMDARGVMHPKLESFASAYFIRENPHRTAAQIRAEIEALLARIHEIEFYSSGAFTRQENKELQALYAELRAVEGK